jgi:hypothetical protein
LCHPRTVISRFDKKRGEQLLEFHNSLSKNDQANNEEQKSTELSSSNKRAADEILDDCQQGEICLLARQRKGTHPSKKILVRIFLFPLKYNKLHIFWGEIWDSS